MPRQQRSPAACAAYLQVICLSVLSCNIQAWRQHLDAFSAACTAAAAHGAASHSGRRGLGHHVRLALKCILVVAAAQRVHHHEPRVPLCYLCRQAAAAAAAAVTHLVPELLEAHEGEQGPLGVRLDV